MRFLSWRRHGVAHQKGSYKMATKELLAQLKLRKDTAANWTEQNPILGNGEMIIVETSSGEQRFKLGDGEKTFTQLPYADENILSKIKNYTAGDGISISNEGVISSTGSGSGSDVFVIEFTWDDNGNITSASKTFEEAKQAIQNNKIIAIPHLLTSDNEINFCQSQFFMTGTDANPDEQIVLKVSVNYIFNRTACIVWVKASDGTETYTVIADEGPVWISDASELSNSGTAYWNATNKSWEIKDITSDPTQSNWQQNDSTAIDYIQNRPGAYDAQTTAFTLDYDLTTESDTVRFDSNGKPDFIILGKTLPGGNIHNFDTSTWTVTSNTNGTVETVTDTGIQGMDYTEFHNSTFSAIAFDIFYVIDKKNANGTYTTIGTILKYASSYIDQAVSEGNATAAEATLLRDNYLIACGDEDTHLTITQTAGKNYTVPLDAKYNIQDIYTAYGLTTPIRIVNNCIVWGADWGSNISVTNTASNGHQTIDAKVPKYTAGEGISIASSGSNYIISATGSSSSAEELCAEVTLGEKDTSKSIGEWVLVYPGTVANSVTYDQALAAFNSNTPVKIRVTSTKTISGTAIPIISEAYMTRYIAAQNALIFDYVHNATDLSVSSGGIVWTSDGTITCYTATYSFAFGSTDTSAASVQVPTTTKVQDMIDAAVSNIDTSGGSGSVAGGYTIQVSNAAPATGTSSNIITYVVEGA